MKAFRFSILGLFAVLLTGTLPSCSSKVRGKGADEGMGGIGGGAGGTTTAASTTTGSTAMGGAAASTTVTSGAGTGGTSSSNATTGGAGGTMGGSAGSSTGGVGGSGGALIMKCTDGDEFCECDEVGCFVAVAGPCTQDTDCKTQECGVTQDLMNICCEQECDDTQVCSASGTECEKADPCPEGEYRCNIDYQQCVDGDWVTIEECDGRGCDVDLGSCKYDLGDTCTGDDECGAGTCQETATGGQVCCNSTCGVCQRCNDAGDACTTPSSVPVGCACTPSDVSNCLDSYSCTDDICVNDACQNPVVTGCLIGNQCVSSGARQPGNPCRECNPLLNTNGWSNVSNGTSCDDGLWCNGDNDLCDGLGNCSHTYGPSGRCASRTGACEVQTCSESKKNCWKDEGTICDEETWSGCLQGSSCSSDVFSWPVRYICSGSSANCGTTPNEAVSEATLVSNCNANQWCEASSGSCQAKLGCGNTYCQGGLCWTKANAPGMYTENEGRIYCSNLSFAGRVDWRLPTVAEFQTLVLSSPVGGCYWPSVMGDCNDELWSTDESQSFAFWVGTAALQISSTPLYVRCVVNE